MNDDGIRALFTSQYTTRSIAIAGATILHAVNVLIATTILPSVVRDIGGQNLYAWNTTLYVVASIVGAALAPRVLVRLGPQQAFRMAVVAFLVGALVCTFAPTMIVLLLGRTVQGFGGGFLSALTYVIIRQAYPQRLWPRAFALNSAMWGVATVSGPTIGGVFGEFGVWRLAFGSVVPIALALLVLFERVLRGMDRPEMAQTRLPGVQLALLCAAVLAVSAGSVTDDPILNAVGIASAAVLLVALARVEGRSRRRLFPSGTFALRTPMGAIILTMVLLMIGISSDVFAPYFLQALHGLSPLWAGYMVALLSAGWTISSISVADHSGARERTTILTGPLVIFAGMILLALAMPHTDAPWPFTVAAGLGLLLLGLGMGAAWPHLLTRALAVAHRDEQALAASAMTTVQLVAAAFGAAFGGVITNLLDYSDVASGDTARAAAWFFGLFCLAPGLAFLTTLLVARRPVALSGSGQEEQSAA